jgi:hypothetical protein
LIDLGASLHDPGGTRDSRSRNSSGSIFINAYLQSELILWRMQEINTWRTSRDSRSRCSMTHHRDTSLLVHFKNVTIDSTIKAAWKLEYHW